jgi:hypothetical protein
MAGTPQERDFQSAGNWHAPDDRERQAIVAMNVDALEMPRDVRQGADCHGSP